MRFASLQSSNTNDYASAGKQVADSAAAMFKTQRENAPDYAELSKRAMVEGSKEKIAAMKAEMDVTNAGIKAQAQVQQQKIKSDTLIWGAKQDAKTRKAGMIAGLGKIAGAGYLASRDNTKDRPYPSANDSRKQLWEKYTQERDALNSEFDANTPEFKPSSPSFVSPSSSSSSQSSSTTGGGTAGKVTAGTGSVLTGNQKTVADAIARYESGDWGYEAFNQGGRAGGTRVVGKSGSHAETFGRSLTDMTLGEIFHRQNTKQRGLSFQQHLDQDGLHAVGRYQFIGSTLQDEVRRMGLSHDTKFTPKCKIKSLSPTSSVLVISHLGLVPCTTISLIRIALIR